MALTTVSSERLSTNVKTSNLGTELKKKVGQSKNLIINGAMQVAQRATSSQSSGYQTVDRFKTVYSGLDNAPTFEQVDTSSSDTPYTLGLRKAFKVTNGNQTSVGAADNFSIEYKIEAQNIGQSGWNFKSATSFITLSFWVKSSVAQNFAIRLFNQDATYAYSFVFAATTSWTKITHSIKGDSGIVINNDNGGGLNVNWVLFEGTDNTTSGHVNETWATYSGTDKVGDMTSTWYDTDDATFEITGAQLEVGSVATDFEHLSFADDLRKCQRYCYVDRGSEDYHAVAQGHFNGSSTAISMLYTPVCMRAAPTLAYPVGTWIFSADSGTIAQSNIFPSDNIGGVNAFQIRGAVSGAPSGEGFLLRTSSTGHTWILDSEL